VYKTANQTDHIEEMYKEQSKIDEDRRKEQEIEMSQREAKILELRWLLPTSCLVYVPV